jgi:paired amphipathic helix protein Sin3a
MQSSSEIFMSLLQPPPGPPQLQQLTGTPSPTDSSLPATTTIFTTTPAPPAPAPAHAPDAGKALDVTDALTYLDLVKVRFESLPSVYNQLSENSQLLVISLIIG